MMRQTEKQMPLFRKKMKDLSIPAIAVAVIKNGKNSEENCVRNSEYRME